jgi:hypothetical protein
VAVRFDTSGSGINPQTNPTTIARIIAKLLTIFGWLFLVLGGLRVALSLIALFASAPGFNAVVLLSGAAVALTGLVAVGAGESIGVFFAIEDNTRAAAEHLYKIVSEKNPPKT